MPKNAKQSTASSKELATLAASVLGARGGAAGVGEAKRRGSSEHYRELARARWDKRKPDKTPKK